MRWNVAQIVKEMHKIAPREYAEEWDNVGLLVGNPDADVNRVLVCLEVNDEVAMEAAAKKAELIISHHPLLYRPLKQVVSDDIKGKVVYNLISRNIALYCAHTNLDAAKGGLGDVLAEHLGLRDIEVLDKRCFDRYKKIVVFVPESHADAVRDAMSRAGAGWIGNYSDCSFMVRGTGTFSPGKGTTPYIGEQGRLEKVQEYELKMIIPEGIQEKVIHAMIQAHPYEEVAYDIYPLDICTADKGFGRVGNLYVPTELEAFLKIVKDVFDATSVRLIGNVAGPIRRVAIFNGSYDKTIYRCLDKKADILLSGDIKYHDARDIVDLGMCAVDVGHYETEKKAMEIFASQLSQKFDGVEMIISKVNVNPYRYV